MVFKREGFLVIGDHDVVDIGRLAHKRARLRIFPTPFMKIRRDPRAQILRLANVDDLALGVLVEVHAGRSGNRADFGSKVHRRSAVLIYL